MHQALVSPSAIHVKLVNILFRDQHLIPIVLLGKSPHKEQDHALRVPLESSVTLLQRPVSVVALDSLALVADPLPVRIVQRVHFLRLMEP